MILDHAMWPRLARVVHTTSLGAKSSDLLAVAQQGLGGF